MGLGRKTLFIAPLQIRAELGGILSKKMEIYRKARVAHHGKTLKYLPRFWWVKPTLHWSYHLPGIEHLASSSSGRIFFSRQSSRIVLPVANASLASAAACS